MNRVQKKRVLLRPLQGSYKPPRSSSYADSDIESAPEPQTKVHSQNITLTVPEEPGPSAVEYLRNKLGWTMPREENIPRMDKLARQKIIQNAQRSLRSTEQKTLRSSQQKSRKTTQETLPSVNFGSIDMRSVRTSATPVMLETRRSELQKVKRSINESGRQSVDDEQMPPLRTESYQRLRNTIRRSLVQGTQRSSVLEEYFNINTHQRGPRKSNEQNDDTLDSRQDLSGIDLTATSSTRLRYGSKRFQRRLSSELRQLEAADRRRSMLFKKSSQAGGLDKIIDDVTKRDEELAQEVRQKLNEDIRLQRLKATEKHEARSARLSQTLKTPPRYRSTRRGSAMEEEVPPVFISAPPSMPVLQEELTPALTNVHSSSSSSGEYGDTSYDVSEDPSSHQLLATGQQLLATGQKLLANNKDKTLNLPSKRSPKKPSV